MTSSVCCLAECDDSVQLSTGMKPRAWPSTARLGSEKYMRMPLEKSTNLARVRARVRVRVRVSRWRRARTSSA